MLPLAEIAIDLRKWMPSDGDVAGRRAERAASAAIRLVRMENAPLILGDGA
jgi:hypothetical protein